MDATHALAIGLAAMTLIATILGVHVLSKEAEIDRLNKRHEEDQNHIKMLQMHIEEYLGMLERARHPMFIASTEHTYPHTNELIELLKCANPKKPSLDKALEIMDKDED